jgi:hypothetical protein
VSSAPAADQPQSAQTFRPPPRLPGWYFDGSGRERWWDGTTWTLYLRGDVLPISTTTRRTTTPKPVRRFRRKNSRTLASWLIALSPLLVAGLHLAAIRLNGYVTWTTVGAAGAVTFGLTLLLALYDNRQLTARGYGYGTVASPYWALLAPAAYLLFRGQRVPRRSLEGLAPFWGHVVVTAAVVVLYLLVARFGGAWAQYLLLPR